MFRMAKETMRSFRLCNETLSMRDVALYRWQHGITAVARQTVPPLRGAEATATKDINGKRKTLMPTTADEKAFESAVVSADFLFYLAAA